MRLPLAAFVLFAIISSPLSASAQVKKYDLKSGVVTLDSVISMGAMKIPSRLVITFDDWGMKERKDTYEGTTLKEVFFSDAQDLYKLMPADKTAFKLAKAVRGTEMKVAWSEVSDKDKKDGKAKKLANRKVAGKDCEAYEVNVSGSVLTVAGWKGILLQQALENGKMKTTVDAVSIDETPKIDPALFKVPADYKLQ